MKDKHKTSIGGQALIEGVMMRGPRTIAMAVRNPKGELIVEKWEVTDKKRAKVFKIPFVRGIFNFIDSLRFGYKCLMRSAEIAGFEDEDEKKQGFVMNMLMFAATVLAIVLSVGLFVYLPVQLFDWLIKGKVLFLDSNVGRSVFEGIVRIVIFIGYILSMLLIKDIRRTFMFHGAEHKTIFCYESEEELTIENVRRQTRFHPRCGTSFLILVLIVGVIVSIFIPKDIAIPLRVALKLLTIPLVVGIGYELIKFAGRHDNVITKIISAPGMWLQHITTSEPDDDMIEAAITAFENVITGDTADDKW
jgi:uncharacterized protein YqhQ